MKKSTNEEIKATVEASSACLCLGVQHYQEDLRQKEPNRMVCCHLFTSIKI